MENINETMVNDVMEVAEEIMVKPEFSWKSFGAGVATAALIELVRVKVVKPAIENYKAKKAQAETTKYGTVTEDEEDVESEDTI